MNQFPRIIRAKKTVANSRIQLVASSTSKWPTESLPINHSNHLINNPLAYLMHASVAQDYYKPSSILVWAALALISLAPLCKLKLCVCVCIPWSMIAMPSTWRTWMHTSCLHEWFMGLSLNKIAHMGLRLKKLTRSPLTRAQNPL
jgi:hypothetical protein